MSVSEEAKAARREYYRRYRAEHPEKVREANRRYWEKKANKAAKQAKKEDFSIIERLAKEAE